MSALRTLRQSPIASVVIVLSLAVGIAANTIVFSWIQRMILQPIPGVVASGQLQTIEARTATGSYPGLSWSDYRDVRASVTALDSLLAYRSTPLYVGEPGRDERISGLLVSDNYFSVLDLAPALGRFFRAEEISTPGNAPVAVISHDYWETRFARSPSAIGQTLVLNGTTVTIIGVAPAPFQGTAIGLYFDVWVPATLAPVLLNGSRELESRELRGYYTLGRLKSSASQTQLRAEATTAFRRLAENFPETNGSFTAEVTNYRDASRGAQTFMGPALATLQVVMLLVLLLVCANTANLLLARAATRRQEIGVRLALGASPWRIIRQLLAEGALLAGLAVALGALLSLWGVDAFRSLPMPGGIPIKIVPTLDLGGLAFAVLLASACSLLFSLAPAFQLARTDVRTALHGGGSSNLGGTPGRARLRGWLIGTEAALALIVLVIAGLFMKNLLENRDGDPGFRTRDITLAAYDLSGRGYDKAATLRFTRDLLERLRAEPGIEAAAIASTVPLDLHGLPSRAITVDGRPRDRAKSDTAIALNLTPGYFATLQIPFLAGSDFAGLEDTTHPKQIIINEEFARRYLAGLPTVGNKVTVGTTPYEIAGVVRTTRYESLAEPPQPAMFFSYRDATVPAGQIYLRTRTTELAVAARLRAILAEIDPRIRSYDVRTFTQHIDKNLFMRRVPARLFTLLGPFALLLAAIGIYAVVANGVAQRTREIGLRLALGAAPHQIVSLLMRAGLRPVLIGLASGVALVSLVVLHLPAGKGPGFALQLSVTALLLAVAALACWLPSRRATKIDSLIALRSE